MIEYTKGKPGSRMLGESNGKSTLTEEQVRAIRAMYTSIHKRSL